MDDQSDCHVPIRKQAAVTIIVSRIAGADLREPRRGLLRPGPSAAGEEVASEDARLPSGQTSHLRAVLGIRQKAL
jgi:hypothetical protein